MIERKLRLGIEDIKGVCLECLSCRGRVYLPLEKIRILPSMCPVCSVEWMMVASSHSTSNSDYANFTFALRKMQEAIKQGNGMPFKVWLEFDEPESR